MAGDKPLHKGETRPYFKGLTGKGVKVAVIDSGINPQHSHVQKVAGGVSITLGEKGKVIYGDDYTDKIGHGTAISGIIRWIAPEVELYAIKIFEQELTTHSRVLIEAINWAVVNEINVINLSLEVVKSKNISFLKKIITSASEKKIVFVSSGKEVGNVIVVGSDENCNPPSYSYRKKERSFFASPFPRPIPGLRQENNFRGISFATAYITGWVTLIKEEYPHGDIKKIKKELSAFLPKSRYKNQQ